MIKVSNLLPESVKWENAVTALGQSDPKHTRDQLLKSGHYGNLDAWDSIIKDDTFQNWKTSNDVKHALVWACGVAATAKTELALFVIDHLEHSDLNPKDYWVLYLLCGRAEENRTTAVSILKGLLWLFCKRDPALAKYLCDEFQFQDIRLVQDHQVEAFWQVFEKMVDNCRAKRIYCVIDGIETCGSDDSDCSTLRRDTLQDFLRRMSHLLRSHSQEPNFQSPESPTSTFPNSSRTVEPCMTAAEKFRVLILAQKLPQASMAQIADFPQLQLKIEPAVESLIQKKVRRVSTMGSKTREPSEEMLQTIDQILTSGPSQSLQFVGLVSEKIEGMTLDKLRKYRKNAPKSIEEFHTQTLQNIPPKFRLSVLAMLKWVALAERPLTTSQLTKAIKYSLDKSFTAKSLTKILSYCPGLVTKRPVTKRHHRVVLGEEVSKLLFDQDSPLLGIKQLQGFVSTLSNTHSELTNACVAYLQDSANLERSRTVRLREGDQLKKADRIFFEKHPFLEYAIVNWPYHAKRGNFEKTDFDVAFFGDRLPRRRLWWESYWISLPLRKWVAWKWTAPGDFSLLHLAAFFDIVPLAQYVEAQGNFEELILAEDHYGMKPINWATEKSASGMVQFLLERGDFDNAALLQAARTGQIPILRMLLENRHKPMHSPQVASPISSPNAPSTPLQSFRKVTLRSLSDFSKPSDRTDKAKQGPLSPTDAGYGKAKSETALHVAAACGHDEAVAVLLDAREDVHLTTDGGWTPLHNAAWFGRVAVVERLIAAGADPDASTKDGLKPLHCAVKNSQPCVVQMLLDKDIVNMDAEDQFGNTPFHMACKCHDIAIMDILLAHKVDIERRMRVGWTPLMWTAVADQAHDVAKWLLEHNANVNAIWIHSHAEAGDSIELNALDLAKAYQRPSVADLLKRHGAVDNKSLLSRSSIDLPLPGALEETYDLPEVHEMVALQLDRTDTEDSRVSSDDDISSDIEVEDSSEDEASNDESQSRKPSASSIENEQKSRRQSSFATQGLGISEEVEEKVEVPAPRLQSLDAVVPPPVSPLHAADERQDGEQPATVLDTNGRIRQDSSVLVQEPETYLSKDESLDTDIISEPSVGVHSSPAVVDTSLDSANERKSSGSKSPNAIGDMLTRINWRRMGSSGSVSNGTSLPVATSEPSIPSDGDIVVRNNESNSPGGSQDSRKDSVFGRLKVKRGFSWKKENDNAKNAPFTGLDPHTEESDR